MRRTGLITVALLAIVAGCRGSDKADQPLNNDLNLAAQQAHAQDSISALERSGSATTVHTVRHAPTGEVSTTHRTSTSSGTSSQGAATTTTTTEKHTGRDAAIGAAAGAIIGATTSKDKVKGGIIGAAAGGILGGVIGNNVDVKKKP